MEILSATRGLKSQVLYSDVNPDVNTESALELVYNEDSINKSIVTILGTRKGTRVFRRNFGSYLQDMLFDPMDPLTVGRIKRELMQAIQDWEPRIILKAAEVLPDYENTQYYVELTYVIPTLSGKSVSFNFNLNKGT